MDIKIPRPDADYSAEAISQFGFSKGDKVSCNACEMNCQGMTIIGVATSVNSKGRKLLWVSDAFTGKIQASSCVDAQYKKQ